MPANRSLLLPLMSLVAIALLSGPAVEAQSAASLFDGQTLHDLRIHVHSRDLAELRARYNEDVYFPADLIWQNIRVRNVGVRSRGLGSRNPTKLALHVSMNRYTPGQTFLGLRSLILDNLWEDPAMMREPLAMASRSAGSSSTTSTRVSIRWSRTSTRRFLGARSGGPTGTCSSTSGCAGSSGTTRVTITQPTG
jgi:spore coat protein CotH